MLAVLACSGCIYNASTEPIPSTSPQEPTEDGSVPPTAQMPANVVAVNADDEFYLNRAGYAVVPGIVNLDKLYVGAEVEYYQSIINGNDRTRTFQLRVVTETGNLRDGYEWMPASDLGHITIANALVVLPPSTKQTIPIFMTVARGWKDKKLEVHIAISEVFEKQQSYMTEHQCRWLLNSWQ